MELGRFDLKNLTVRFILLLAIIHISWLLRSIVTLCRESGRDEFRIGGVQ